MPYSCGDAGRGKTLGGPALIGGDNLPFPVGIGLTDWGAVAPWPGPSGSGITELHLNTNQKFSKVYPKILDSRRCDS